MPRAWQSGTGGALNNSEEIWKPHATVAAIAEQDGRFLLVRECIDGQEVLNQPAGHVDADETIEQAVVRETLEETGYQFAPERLCGIYRFLPDPTSERTYLRFSFSGTVGERVSTKLDKEIICAEWMTLEQLQACREIHRTPMVEQCILDYLHKPSYPLQVFSDEFA
jgi:8-oxo-dGTP pyrophosphatase MutT (NUDIX family)